MQNDKNKDIHNVNNLKIEKNDLRSFLYKRYTKKVSDFVFGQISFSGNSMKLSEYAQKVSKLSQLGLRNKFKLAFNIFDRDSDGKIT